MPRRWATDTRKWAYNYLSLRDGNYCQLCRYVPTTRYGLDIDHIDRNKNNNVSSNLRLLCHSCNVSDENKKRRKIPSVAERERENPSTRIVKSSVVYRDGSAEMQANYLFELDYRNWLNDYIDENGFIPKKEAINAGAEVVGCNPTTSAKYLAKLTSIVGPLAEMKDMLGEVIIIPRNGNKDES